ncbi:MAG: EamA family transporter, partial [Candidatus Marinimicrobia bacterium]|nr:EamA family transporter [Candidatus Neomarinimicrobiota bacterium]
MKIKINLVLVVALFAVSTSSIIARFLPEVSSIVISFWRLVFASIAVWLYSHFKPQNKINMQNIIPFILSGFFLGLHFVCFYQAVKLISIANATLLGITAPMFTLLIERFVFKSNFKKIVFIGFAVALIGTIMITGWNFSITDSTEVGKLYGLSAALCIALVYLLANKIRTDTSTVSYTRLLYLIAAMFLLVIAFTNGENIFELNKSDYLWLLALGLFPTILGHSLLYYGIKFTSPTIIASVPLGEPIIASILAWMIFLEKVPFITLVGGILILFGVYLIIINSPRA